MDAENLSPPEGCHWDDDPRVAALLSCHQPRPDDPERAWAGPLPMGLPSLPVRRVADSLAAWLLRAAAILARTADAGDLGLGGLRDWPPVAAGDDPDADDEGEAEAA